MKKIYYLRIICLLLLFSTLFCALSLSASASSFEEALPDTSVAKNVYFANLETGKVLLNKNPDTKIAPASTVKILTALIAIEHFSENLEQTIQVSDKIPLRYDGAYMGLLHGDEISAIDLIYATVCGGYNDAAYALACAISGDVPEFMKLMNKKLAALGAKSSYYTNPAGTDEAGMYTTLSDTSKLVKLANQNETYMTVSSTSAHKISYRSGNKTETFTVNNRNALISGHYVAGYVNSYSNGIIAGMTNDAGYCVATKMKINDATYLCIIMGASATDSSIGSFELATSLIRYARTSLAMAKVMSAKEVICEIPIDFALSKSSAEKKKATVSARIDEDVFLFLPKSADLSTEITYKYYLYSDTLTAPIFSGERVGGVDFFYNGELVASTALIVSEDIAENEFLIKMENFKKAIFNRATIISAILFSALLCSYLVLENKLFRRRTKKAFKITNSRKL